MKKLKKILLINWLYFSKEIIEVGDINFLTGKNGAGKSTVIDALQIVLLGETNARNFNQAANEKSQRTLDGYLRADMDENNPYSRRGKDFSSYIACEFQDDVVGSSFVTGVVFDCRSDGSRQERFFICVGTLPENCFVENGEAMEIPALRRFLKQNYVKAEIYDTQKEYRRNMLSRWNVHNEQVLRMMKKAVSFRPIVDIQKFITENICDIPEKPDIEAMQQNIRDYKRHEMLAQRQEEKLTALQEIGKLYREMNQAIDRWRVQSFLVLWSKKEIEQAQIDRFELEKRDSTTELAAIEKSIMTISDRIAQKENRRRELDLACAQSSVFQEEEKLRNRKQALQDEQKRLMQDLQSLALEIKKESFQLNGLCDSVLKQNAEEVLLPVQEAAESVLKTYSLFVSGGYEIFSYSSAPFESAQQAAAELIFSGPLAPRIKLLVGDATGLDPREALFILLAVRLENRVVGLFFRPLPERADLAAALLTVLYRALAVLRAHAPSLRKPAAAIFAAAHGHAALDAASQRIVDHVAHGGRV